MKAEIIAVGTELLLGDVINSNAAWISQELASLGIDVHHHVTVGDNPERIRAVVRHALSRTADRPDALIFTGGLGPTEDDLTVATLADYFQAPLSPDPDSEKRIKEYFITRNTPMSNTNLKQALKPQGAETLPNPVGTAPGIMWDVSEKLGKKTLILTFPGVPKELYAMWPTGRDYLRHHQREMGEGDTVLIAQFLHFFGVGESMLAEKLRDLMDSPSPTVAPYVGKAEVRIRVAAKAATTAEANALIEPMKEEIIRRCGRYYIGENGVTIEQSVAKDLVERGLRVSVAESCTGGLVSSRLTDVPGSSAYTTLNVVTYANEQKARLLNVSETTLARHGAVSPQVAGEMAQGVRALSNADIGLSLTGIAGPTGGSDDKPVGLVYIGLSGLEGERTIVKKIVVNRNYGRQDIKFWFSQYALHFLRLYLQGALEPDEAPQAEPV